jgi:proline iminopeptidase
MARIHTRHCRGRIPGYLSLKGLLEVSNTKVGGARNCVALLILLLAVVSAYPLAAQDEFGAQGSPGTTCSQPCSSSSARGSPGGECSQPCFSRSKVTSIIGNARKIVSPNGVEELLEIPVGGTKQWILVRGRDRSNPILLMIHGGPASPEMGTSWFFENGWEDYFTVVQWDQRGSGKSYNSNDPDVIRPTLTLDRMVEDAAEVVQFLRTRYKKDKIFVLGHSWGSIIGASLAQRHPEWLFAYVGTGQWVDGKDNEAIGYADTLAAAEAADNQRAIAELRGIAPYPRPDGSVSVAQIMTERDWSVFFGGLTYRRNGFSYYEDLFQLSPAYTEADIAAVDKGSHLSLGPILPIMTSASFKNVTRFRCPILLFEGRHDSTTPAIIAQRWLQTVRAPAKKLVWFEDSAHMAFVEEPGHFLVHLVQDVRPYAFARE